MKKADSNDFDQRIAQVIMDPNNRFIPRHPEAGTVGDGHVVMHNGLKAEHGVYGEFGRVLVDNKGVHEPQEERVFAEVLKHIRPGGTMIELGSYWSFYSMCFQAVVPGAVNFMVEPEMEHLEMGMRNFELNGMKGTFIHGSVRDDGLRLDDFITDKIDILNADIQGSELEMLNGAVERIRNKAIEYLFLSTHTQQLHYDCMRFLIGHGYQVIASADFDRETYCFDGVLVCGLPCRWTMDIELANWD